MIVNHIATHCHSQRTFQRSVEKAYRHQKSQPPENNQSIRMLICAELHVI